jgi:hypothetical protein
LAIIIFNAIIWHNIYFDFIEEGERRKEEGERLLRKGKKKIEEERKMKTKKGEKLYLFN